VPVKNNFLIQISTKIEPPVISLDNHWRPDFSQDLRSLRHIRVNRSFPVLAGIRFLWYNKHSVKSYIIRGDVTMFGRLVSICIIALSCLFIGCGVRPQVDFYVTPIATNEEQRIDVDAGLTTTEKAGVRVTVSAVDTVDLLNVTSDADVNPYIYVSDWGVARPRYTVFDVSVKNNRESEIQVNPAGAVLMDETGEQYDAIPYAVFKERYGAYPALEREIIYYPTPTRLPYHRRRPLRRRWYHHYDRYRPRGQYYVRRLYSAFYLKGIITKGTMLRTTKLYPGGKRQGLVVFPILPPEAGRLRLIIPGIVVPRGNKGRKVRFQFDFERIPAVKDENDDKEDA